MAEESLILPRPTPICGRRSPALAARISGCQATLPVIPSALLAPFRTMAEASTPCFLTAMPHALRTAACATICHARTETSNGPKTTMGLRLEQSAGMKCLRMQIDWVIKQGPMKAQKVRWLIWWSLALAGFSLTRAQECPGVPWPATDALGRSLPVAEDVGPPKNLRLG